MFSLILPFHSDVDRLVATLDRVREEAERWRIKEVLLCHNGVPLAPPDRDRIERACWNRARSLHTDGRGIGAGYKLGIQDALQEYSILSASDLPFGFTDVKAFLELIEAHGSTPDLAIGSKAHPSSRVEGRSLVRRATATAFHLLRRVALGRDTPRDSQGSLIVKTSDAREAMRMDLDDGYLFSLELITQFLRAGKIVVELPVTFTDAPGPSSVSVLRDGTRMAWGVFKLARRFRAKR